MNPHDKQSETLPKAVTASLERQYEELCRLRKEIDELTQAANRSKRS
jgi:hypothetical protein